MVLTDAHVHLDGYTVEDLGGVIERAKQTGLRAIVTTGMTLESSTKAVEIADANDIVYAAIGIHPWNVTEPMDKPTYHRFRELAGSSKKIVAVSEVGLDFIRGNGATTRNEQMATFKDFVKLAKEVKLPVIVHSRGAHNELIGILREENASEVGGAMHGFEADERIAIEAMEMGFYIVAGRNLLNPASAHVCEVIKGIPIDRLLIETDTAPNYTSTPGAEKVEPSTVRTVAAKVAELKGILLEEVAEATTKNLGNLLGLHLI